MVIHDPSFWVMPELCLHSKGYTSILYKPVSDEFLDEVSKKIMCI